MKPAARWSLIIAVAALAGFAGFRPAQAFPNFKIQFDKRYLIEGSPLHKAVNGKTTCNICHVGMNKGRLNDYGSALGRLLGSDDIRNYEKIQQVLEKVESEKTGTTTFGELIKEGKLPTTK
jgi:hypothetical protein